MDMTSEGLGEMFEGDFGDMCAENLSLMLMGGRTDWSKVHRRGARTPIGTDGNLVSKLLTRAPPYSLAYLKP